MTPEGYIRKALIDELKVAGAYAKQNPRVVLTGRIDALTFSSVRAITGGSWDIALNVSSSNGKTAALSEHYEFKSGFDGMTACKQTAEAFMPAVQNLIGQLVKSPEFPALVSAAPPAQAAAAAPVVTVTTPPPVVAPPVAPVAAPVVPVAVPPAPVCAVAPPARQFTYQAECTPEVRACGAADRVSLMSASNGVETYSATCASGDLLVVRCEWGSCRVLR